MLFCFLLKCKLVVLARITQAGSDPVDGDVDDRFVDAAELFLPAPLDHFQLDVVQDVEVRKAVVQAAFQRRVVFQKLAVAFNLQDDFLGQFPFLLDDVKD